MTRRGVGFGRGFPRTWLLPIAALTLLLGVAASGRLSRSIVADLIAWWPVWIGLAIAAILLRERKIGQVRVSGVVPLVALLFVLVFTWGHLAGWTIMPSASQRLVGPETNGYTDAALEARIDGIIGVMGGSEFLYQVEPVMRGGGIGIPGANEEVVDSTVAIVLRPPPDPGLYSYAGWELLLADQPRWSLTLDGAIDADLSSLSVVELAVGGSGSVELGRVDRETHVGVDGTFRLVLPAETPARVIGQASVPSSWTLDSEGAVSPVLGTGWIIEVQPGSTLTIVERQPG